jgi:hypothetical protein
MGSKLVGVAAAGEWVVAEQITTAEDVDTAWVAVEKNSSGTETADVAGTTVEGILGCAKEPEMGSDPEPRKAILGDAGGAKEKADTEDRLQKRMCATNPRAAQ